MYSIIDNLIFPSPKPSYTLESLRGKLIYVPKFDNYKSEFHNPMSDGGRTQKD